MLYFGNLFQYRSFLFAFLFYSLILFLFSFITNPLAVPLIDHYGSH